MKVPFHKLSDEFEDEAESILESMAETAASGRYLFGPKLEELESALSFDLTSEDGRVVCCHSGTDALILSLMAAGVQSGDEVLLPANTAVATGSAIVSVGAIPVFVDIETSTWLIDLNLVKKKISSKTKAIIPVHLFGNLVPLDKLREVLEFSDRPDLAIIEDTAQAQGGIYRSQAAGTLGDFGCFSFFPTKNLGAMGDGGAIFCRNVEKVEKLRAFRFYGQEERNYRIYNQGINSRLDEFQAGILLKRLSTYRAKQKKKGEQIDLYRSELRDLPIEFQVPTPQTIPSWHLSVVKFPTKNIRNNIKIHLENFGIETIIHYPSPLHLHPGFSDFYLGPIPVAEDFAQTILSLPIGPRHTKEDITYVIEKIKRFFQDRGY